MDPFGRGKTVLRAGAGILLRPSGMREVSTAGARMPPSFSRVTVRRPSFHPAGSRTGTQGELVPNGVDYRPTSPTSASINSASSISLPRNMVVEERTPALAECICPGRSAISIRRCLFCLEDGRLFFPEGARDSILLSAALSCAEWNSTPSTMHSTWKCSGVSATDGPFQANIRGPRALMKHLLLFSPIL